jgi:hypothetical protein
MSKSQPIPLKVKNEGRVFAITLAVSKNRLIELLHGEGMAMGVISVRRVTEDEKDALEAAKEDNDYANTKSDYGFME